VNAYEKTRAKPDREDTGESLDPLVTEILRDGPDALNAELPDSKPGGQQLAGSLQAAFNALRSGLGKRVLAKARTTELLPERTSSQEGGGHALVAPDETSSLTDFEWDARESERGESTFSTVRDEFQTMSEQTKERDTPKEDPSEKQAVGRLSARYRKVLSKRRIGRAQGYALRKLLGRGGQGKVFLTKRRGADEFGFVAAIKLFSPEPYPTVARYEAAMRRIARVASLVAQAHHPNLVDVLFFDRRYGIRMMLMELVDGFDLLHLLKTEMHDKLRETAPDYLWDEINKDLVTYGRRQLRMRPGFAVAIVRDCLAGLALLHRRRVVHGDIKPSNIMLDRISGHAKLVDLGSAFDLDDTLRQRFFTLAYAAPEVLERRQWTPQSDLASLGYVLIELLAGRRLFTGVKSNTPSQQREPLDKAELLRRKKELPDYFADLVPIDVRESKRLMGLCRRLVDPDPRRRFPNAEDADLDPQCGAYAFLQELVKGDLDRVYEKGIRDWIEALK